MYKGYFTQSSKTPFFQWGLQTSVLSYNMKAAAVSWLVWIAQVQAPVFFGSYLQLERVELISFVGLLSTWKGWVYTISQAIRWFDLNVLHFAYFVANNHFHYLCDSTQIEKLQGAWLKKALVGGPTCEFDLAVPTISFHNGLPPFFVMAQGGSFVFRLAGAFLFLGIPLNLVGRI